MAIVNHNWYAGHATRLYPIDDRATGLTDTGRKLPVDILVDCQLRWPESAGRYAYLGGITVTSRLVTAVFMAADSPDAATTFTPLAAVSLVKPVAAFTYVPVQALLPGVGGFVVFGDLLEGFSGQFSTPQQSLLAHRIGQAYPQPPVSSLRKKGRAVGLTGLVRMLAGPDLTVTAETVTVAGSTTTALVFRLVDGTVARNVLSLYTGPSGARPESRNCSRAGVETINGVGPDCDGDISLVFNGFASEMYLACGSSVGAGLVLTDSLGITDICTLTRPTRYVAQNQCPDGSSETTSSIATEDPETFSEPSLPGGSPELPFADAFPDAANWTVRTGTFVSSAGAYGATDLSQQNIATCDGWTGAAIDTEISVDVFFSDIGVRHTGGLILNYRRSPSTGYATYFAVFLDRERNSLRILRFTGAVLVEEAAVSLLIPITLEAWYRVTATVTTTGSQVTIAAQATGVTIPGWPTVTTAVLTNQYGPTTGRFGIGSDSSDTICTDFTIIAA